MRTRLLSFDQMQFYVGAGDSKEESTNQNELRAAAALLHTAVKRELTDRQRECVERYYFERQTMEEIGACLHISKSTVCRHLQKAKLRLRRAMDYAGMARQNPRDD